MPSSILSFICLCVGFISSVTYAFQLPTKPQTKKILPQRTTTRTTTFPTSPLYASNSSNNASSNTNTIIIEKTEEEWKEILNPEQFNVLRREGTEPAWTSPLNDVKEDGTFVCAGCGSPLFVTSTKYEVRTVNSN